LEEEEAI